MQIPCLIIDFGTNFPTNSLPTMVGLVETWKLSKLVYQQWCVCWLVFDNLFNSSRCIVKHPSAELYNIWTIKILTNLFWEICPWAFATSRVSSFHRVSWFGQGARGVLGLSIEKSSIGIALPSPQGHVNSTWKTQDLQPANRKKQTLSACLTVSYFGQTLTRPA